MAMTPFEFLEALKNPDTRVVVGAESEDFMILANCVVLTHYSSVTDILMHRGR